MFGNGQNTFMWRHLLVLFNAWWCQGGFGILPSTHLHVSGGSFVSSPALPNYVLSILFQSWGRWPRSRDLSTGLQGPYSKQESCDGVSCYFVCKANAYYSQDAYAVMSKVVVCLGHISVVVLVIPNMFLHFWHTFSSDSQNCCAEILLPCCKPIILFVDSALSLSL